MKTMVIALSVIAAVSAPASAADMVPPLYSKAPPPPVAAVANWTGCYVGGGGGYGTWSQENTMYIDPPFVAVRTQDSGTANASGRGFFGTAQGGCDYQFGAGPWSIVVGGFGDFDFADIHGSFNPPGAGFLFGDEKLSSQWSVGGRVGALVTPQLLTYFVGGYTEAKFDQINFNALFGVPPVISPVDGQYIPGQIYKGWFVGAGEEFALNYFPGLFWKTEYRFSEFDTGINRFFHTPNNSPTNFSLNSDKFVQTVRSELVYRFNWGAAPVAARY